MAVFIVRAQTPEGVADVVTLIPPAFIAKNGLRAHAIVGGLARPLEKGEEITRDVFSPNFFFVEFLHEFLRSTAWKEPACLAAAQRMGEGWVYLIDQRTPDPGGEVPPEDIIGAIQVTAGKLVPKSYQRFPKHLILSDRGFFRLSPWLHTRLVQAMSNDLPET